MATYYFKGQGNQHAYDAPGFVLMRQLVDIPKFALGEFLEDSSGAPVTLSNGFLANDKLVIAKQRAGLMIRTVGIKLITPEGGVATLSEIGDDSDSTGYMDVFDLNAVAGTVKLTGVDDGYGADNEMGRLLDGDTEFFVVFSANTDAAVFEVSMEALQMFSGEGL